MGYGLLTAEQAGIRKATEIEPVVESFFPLFHERMVSLFKDNSTWGDEMIVNYRSGLGVVLKMRGNLIDLTLRDRASLSKGMSRENSLYEGEGEITRVRLLLRKEPELSEVRLYRKDTRPMAKVLWEELTTFGHMNKIGHVDGFLPVKFFGGESPGRAREMMQYLNRSFFINPVDPDNPMLRAPSGIDTLTKLIKENK